MIPVKQFCDKHSINSDTIYVMKCKGATWAKKVGKDLLVDEAYLLDLQEYRKRLWLSAHEYYYYFTYVLDLSVMKISKMMSVELGTAVSSWNTYFCDALFTRVDEKRITDMYISERLEQFVKVSEEIIPQCHMRNIGDIGYKNRLKDMI